MLKNTLWATSIALLLVSCTAEPDLTDDTKDKVPSEEHSFAQNEFEFIGKAFDVKAYATPEMNRLSGIDGTDGFVFECATTTVAPAGSGYDMIIDFGNAGCSCADGRIRQGKLVGSFSGKWSESGTVLSITPVDYFVTSKGGTKYKATFDKQTVTYTNTSNGHRFYTTKVENARLESASGTIKWSCDRTVEWTDGISTSPVNNTYSVTGTASGTATNGISFTANILDALQVKTDCDYIVKGKLSLQPVGGSERVIDYGTGACDNEATLTVNGFVTSIVLK
ncbi:MAG: hypothetical protein ACKVTZ_08885 [Bacteroidia bacterium]